MTAISKSTTTKDQEKFLVNKLLERAYLKLVMDAICDDLTMREGSGDTAYFVRYKRMSVPVETLVEGVTPVESTIDLDEVNVVLDQWGDFLILTDVVMLTTKHPLLQEARRLLADNAARVMDREITMVLLAGTNVQYWDGSVITRDAITSDMIMNQDVVAKININLTMGGASPIGGQREDAKQNKDPNYNMNLEYIAIIGPHLKQEILRPSVNFGTFIQNNVYNQKGSGVTMGAVGKWAGCLWIETNFIPVYTLFGDKIEAAVAGTAPNGLTGVTFSQGAGGALANATTYYWKIVRRNKLRGFPENVSRDHSTLSGGATRRYTFVFDANYYYDLYFGTAAADSSLKLVSVGNINETVNVDSVPTSTITAPANINVAGVADPSAVHVVFICGEGSVAWAGFYKTKVMLSSPGATNTDPLEQRRTIGYKFYGKAVIKNNDFLVRLELASTYTAAFV